MMAGVSLPTLEDLWLEGVLRYLRGGDDRVYELSSGEITYAHQAVALQQLVWVELGESVRLPAVVPSHNPHGPYR
jgi:hypothetical protein